MAAVGNPTLAPNVEYIVITFWDKIYIVCGAAALLLLLLLCMLCILCPECFCPCCVEDEKKRQFQRDSDKSASQRSNASKGSYGSTDSDFMYGSGDIKDSGPIRWMPLDVIREQTTDWSSDASSGQDVISLDRNKKRIGFLPNGSQNGDVHPPGTPPVLEKGEIHFALSYVQTEEKLVIKINEVKDVVLTENQQLISPYVRVCLYRSPKQFFTFRDGGKTEKNITNLEKELKTRMKRPSDVLAYKETFEIPMDLESLKSMTINILLCDMDKFSRHVTLGEISVNLKKANLLNIQEREYSEDFSEPNKENLGTLTLGTSYLPTSEKLYLTVESMKDLRIIDKNSGTTDACVKIYLMYEGKQLKRVKTTVRKNDTNPVFNESFSFDVPQTEIEKVYFSLVICHYNGEKKGTKLIGRIYLGTNFGPEARDFWGSMIQNPRKKIVKTFDISS
ncbi:SYT3-like protein [Mya arenaria]|uniref:SYT3-like protein n=1 Tax=Mya arenaria TaxID=6604 RepID=A0ABY7F0K0_MYAAR|nr:synaptotagmin-B-like [Mya arenaria]WAR15115.1 SYT3-like protein [Mya arenaria]